MDGADYTHLVSPPNKKPRRRHHLCANSICSIRRDRDQRQPGHPTDYHQRTDLSLSLSLSLSHTRTHTHSTQRHPALCRWVTYRHTARNMSKAHPSHIHHQSVKQESTAIRIKESLKEKGRERTFIALVI